MCITINIKTFLPLRLFKSITIILEIMKLSIKKIFLFSFVSFSFGSLLVRTISFFGNFDSNLNHCKLPGQLCFCSSCLCSAILFIYLVLSLSAIPKVRRILAIRVAETLLSLAISRCTLVSEKIITCVCCSYSGGQILFDWHGLVLENGKLITSIQSWWLGGSS